MLAEVAGPDQRAAKKMRPGHCTKKNHPVSPEVTFLGTDTSSYFYDHGMFIFRWTSNFVEKVVLNESMSAKMAPRVSYLVYYYCR